MDGEPKVAGRRLLLSVVVLRQELVEVDEDEVEGRVLCVYLGANSPKFHSSTVCIFCDIIWLDRWCGK